MSWKEVATTATAVARGFKNAGGLVTASLRGLGNRRAWGALVDAAKSRGYRSTRLPASGK